LRLASAGHDSSSLKNRQGPVETAAGSLYDTNKSGCKLLDHVLGTAGRSVMATIWALLIYWLVTFVGCYIVIEIGQDQLYDEVTPYVGLKVILGSLLLAVMLTVFYHKGLAASFDSMFTNNILCTVFQAIVWFGVFTLIFQFHPWHALGLGIATMLMVQGLATMGVNSILSPTPAAVSRPAAFPTNQPVRQSLGPAPAQPATGAETKSK
jgi:hypothetical protein